MTDSRPAEPAAPPAELVAGLAAAAVDPGRADWPDLLRTLAPDADPEALGREIREVRARGGWGLGTTPAPADRLAALRAEMAAAGLDAFLVPLADEHQGEFVAPRARRLEWLTGFGGSAGLAVVLADRAAIFVDGRYTLQVREQVDTALFEPEKLGDGGPEAWLAEALEDGMTVGFDPWLHTADGAARLRRTCERAGAALTAVEDNPLDAAWTGRPPPPLGPVVAHPLAFAGSESRRKRDQTGALVGREGCAAAVLTAPDSIAWLLNVRGHDVANTPIALGFAILGADGAVAWYLDPRKVSDEVRAWLGDGVTVAPPEDFAAGLDALGVAGARVAFDGATGAEWIRARLEAAGATVVSMRDPCVLPKARKNETEIAGTRAAHLRDGAALASFLAWLARTAPRGELTEMSAGAALYGFRAGGEHFRGVSFETISGAGPNGAIVHYRVTPATDRALRPGDVYLVDSGAQYLDGTTDVTRTVFIDGAGPAPAETRDRFTRVLKGHIAVATARFPAGTGGGQIDALARLALWEAGLDYDHGTGHGVGSYLGVHEGPQRISKLGQGVPLEPGMIVSNEPGYYRTGAYGIRIENLVAVRADGTPDGGEREMLSFETLTLAPIDRALVAPALLTVAERAWLDSYHARVREALSPLVDGGTRAWLEAATAPI